MNNKGISIHFIQVLGSLDHPGIHKIHWTVVYSSVSWVRAGEVEVVAMGAVAVAAARNKHSPEDGCDGQDIHNLLPGTVL